MFEASVLKQIFVRFYSGDHFRHLAAMIVSVVTLRRLRVSVTLRLGTKRNLSDVMSTPNSGQPDAGQTSRGFSLALSWL